MGYSDTLLASGERTVRRSHQHPFMLIWNSRFAVLALILALVLLTIKFVANLTGPLSDILGWATLALVVYGLLRIGWSYLQFVNEEYLITTRRIIHVEGVVNKKATDSSLEKINDAVLSESIFGRMFGFGDLDVLTASESGIEKLRMLRDAKDFKKAMLEAKHELEIELSRPTMPAMRQDAPPAAPVASATPAGDEMSADEVANALDRLAELKTKGLISPEEFEAKRKELLSRM